jgi:hypothetical protein
MSGNPTGSVPVSTQPAPKHLSHPARLHRKLGIPLTVALAHRAHGIEAAIARLKGNDVERMRAIGPIAVNDIAGVGHTASLPRMPLNAKRCRSGPSRPQGTQPVRYALTIESVV